MASIQGCTICSLERCLHRQRAHIEFTAQHVYLCIQLPTLPIDVLVIGQVICNNMAQVCNFAAHTDFLNILFLVYNLVTALIDLTFNYVQYFYIIYCIYYQVQYTHCYTGYLFTLLYNLATFIYIFRAYYGFNFIHISYLFIYHTVSFLA